MLAKEGRALRGEALLCVEKAPTVVAQHIVVVLLLKVTPDSTLLVGGSSVAAPGLLYAVKFSFALHSLKLSYFAVIEDLKCSCDHRRKQASESH